MFSVIIMKKGNSIEVLKAKVNYNQTFLTISVTATFFSVIAYYTFTQFKITNYIFGLATLIFFFFSIITAANYSKRHQKLIDELKK